MRILTTLGGIGYLAAAFQWLAVLAVSLPNLIDSKLGHIILPERSTQSDPVPVIASHSGTGPDFVTTFLATGLAIAFIALIAYVVVFRYTRAINTTSSRVVHRVAKKAVPIIARRPLAEIPLRQRTILNRRLLFWAKILFAILPLIVLPLVLYDGSRGEAEQLALFVQALLALLATLGFVVQAILTNRWHVKTDNVN
jgi:hypothetical protein